MRIFSTFTGIGGFEIGIQNAFNNRPTGQNEKDTKADKDSPDASGEHAREHPVIVGYSEIDKYATQVYERNYPNVKNYGDITKINASELPDFDCLVGGFPCQAFSIAGRRGGSMIPEVPYSLTLREYCERNGLDYSSLKMLKDCSIMTRGGLLEPSSPRLMNWGTTANGRCLTARITESHKTESESSLSDILEEQPDTTNVIQAVFERVLA